MSEADKKIEVKKEENTEEDKKEDKKSRELSVRRENPFSLFQQMDQLFDELNSGFWNDWSWPFVRRRRPLGLIIQENEPLFRTPLSNITETEDEYKITAEMPGLDKGDIEISIHDGTLEIKGELKEKTKEEGENGEFVRRESRSTSYYRAFTLPEHIDDNKIEANLDKGVLKVNIPKVEPPKPEVKKIEVK